MIRSYYLIWVKHATHLKAKSSIVVSLKKMVGAPSFFSILLVYTTNPTISIKSLFLYFSQFSPSYFTSQHVHKIIPTISTSTALLYISPFFHITVFTYSHPYNLNQNPFPYLSHSVNSICVKCSENKRVLWGLILSLFWSIPAFPIYGKWIKAFTITDPLSPRLKKLIYCVVASDKHACDQDDKPYNPPSPILSTYCHYFHILLKPLQDLICSENQLLNINNFHLRLEFSYTVYVPHHPCLKMQPLAIWFRAPSNCLAFAHQS